MAAEELFPEWPFLFWQANRALTYESHGGINTFGERLDKMPGEVPLLCRPSCRLERHGEFEQREPVPLKAVQQLRGGQLRTPVPQ